MSSQPTTSKKGKKDAPNTNKMVRFSHAEKVTIIEFLKNNYQDLYGNKLAGAQQLKKDETWIKLEKKILDE